VGIANGRRPFISLGHLRPTLPTINVVVPLSAVDQLLMQVVDGSVPLVSQHRRCRLTVRKVQVVSTLAHQRQMKRFLLEPLSCGQIILRRRQRQSIVDTSTSSEIPLRLIILASEVGYLEIPV
jgi:hypothetical protein